MKPPKDACINRQGCSAGLRVQGFQVLGALGALGILGAFGALGAFEGFLGLGFRDECFFGGGGGGRMQ